MSLDVTSLFVNVPFRETVEYTCEQLMGQVVKTTIPVNIVKELLLKCSMTVRLKYTGEMFRQMDGVAIGSPLDPI